MHRRDFLKKAATAVGALCASCLGRPTQAVGLEPSQAIEPPTPTGEGVSLATGTSTKIYMPTVMTNTPAPVGAKVVHVHAPSVTNWTGTPADYWSYVNQEVVNQMVDRGLMELTSQSTVGQAWRALIPNYLAGEIIAIKVNFNNSDAENNPDCLVHDGKIDALIQPVNAIVRGLLQAWPGVLNPQNVWVFDAIRAIPSHFSAGNLHGVSFYDSGCPGHSRAQWTLTAQNAIQYAPPSGIPAPPTTVRLCDLVIQSRYLINLPILKPHASAGVTLGFKNHFGSIDLPSVLHPYIAVDNPNYRSQYNPLIDLYRNAHISGNKKTVLTIGDAIFGSLGYNAPPQRWTSFNNNFPCSIFFASDPVAIDCVMGDFIKAEQPSINSKAFDYLRLASQAGLGVYEQSNPWLSPSPYRSINYQRINL